MERVKTWFCTFIAQVTRYNPADTVTNSKGETGTLCLM
jgi:hypothetical protein